MEPTEPPPKLPPWVKKEILLPVAGVLFVGLIFGNFLVYRAIKKDAQYQPTEFGPMDRRPLPGNLPLGQRIVDTGRTLTETNGVVNFGAEQFTRLTGAWMTLNEEGRTITRMTDASSPSAGADQMYLSYRIQFQTPGRYQLRGLMRSSDVDPGATLNVFWNREPTESTTPDFSVTVASTEYVWNSDIPDSASNTDTVENRLLVDAPGLYTLFLTKEPSPGLAEDGSTPATRHIAIDELQLNRVEEDAVMNHR